MENVNKFQVKGTVKVIKGTIVMPEAGGLKFILSPINMAGKPEGNPLLPVFDKKWSKVRADARSTYASKTGAYKLGTGFTSTLAVQSDVWVIHCLCQDENMKTDLKSLEECLKKVAASAIYEKASLHVSSVLITAIPELPDMLTKFCVEKGVSVLYYQEPQEDSKA
jgi:hypothetical protein